MLESTEELILENPNLQQLLDQIGRASNEHRYVTLGQVVDSVGRRSFGPLLSVVGLILASPLSIIPGLPTTMGVFVLLLSIQLLAVRQELWLPAWLKRRSLASEDVDKALLRMRPVARFVDRWLKRRLAVLVQGPTEYLIAALCLGIALCMPLMEVVPMSASSAGVVFTAFGLALLYHDGLLALIALLFFVTTLSLIVLSLG